MLAQLYPIIIIKHACYLFFLKIARHQRPLKTLDDFLEIVLNLIMIKEFFIFFFRPGKMVNYTETALSDVTSHEPSSEKV